MLVHRERARFHAAARVRHAEILEYALNLPVLAARPVKGHESHVRIDLAYRIDEARVVVQRARFVAEFVQGAHHTRTRLNRDVALRARAAHDYGNALFRAHLRTRPRDALPTAVPRRTVRRRFGERARAASQRPWP